MSEYADIRYDKPGGGYCTIEICEPLNAFDCSFVISTAIATEAGCQSAETGVWEERIVRASDRTIHMRSQCYSSS